MGAAELISPLHSTPSSLTMLPSFPPFLYPRIMASEGWMPGSPNRAWPPLELEGALGEPGAHRSVAVPPLAPEAISTSSCLRPQPPLPSIQAVGFAPRPRPPSPQCRALPRQRPGRCLSTAGRLPWPTTPPPPSRSRPTAATPPLPPGRPRPPDVFRQSPASFFPGRRDAAASSSPPSVPGHAARRADEADRKKRGID